MIYYTYDIRINNKEINLINIKIVYTFFNKEMFKISRNIHKLLRFRSLRNFSVQPENPEAESIKSEEPPMYPEEPTDSTF